MGVGRWIDAAIAEVSPAAGARRMAARVAVEGIRGYDVAGNGRATKGWQRRTQSADAANAKALLKASAAVQDLVRNNKYAAAGVRQMVAAAWGDGIAPMAVHPDPVVRQLAQDDWDRWAEGKVSGEKDWYGHGKVCTRGWYVGGESLTVWKAGADGPDGKVKGYEGEQLDAGKTEMRTDGSRIIQGVEFNADDDRLAYWLFRDHPGGLVYSSAFRSSSFSAEFVDHLYEEERHGQARGISRLAPVALTLRDIADIEDAKRLQEKVSACVALIRQRAEGQGVSPLTREVEEQSGREPSHQTIRPGMVLDLAAGETAHSFTPPPSQGGVDFIRQQVAAVSAVMAPYHAMTGDVSQANYSGLRASFLSQWNLLDDDQQNVLIPLMCKPAWRRRMRAAALEHGDRRLLDVRCTWALPVRRQADPIKDLMAEIMEVRAGLKLLSRSLAERGINAEEHLNEIQRLNAIIDACGLALDTDPRRVTDSGVLQAAAGYLAPRQAAA